MNSVFGYAISVIVTLCVVSLFIAIGIDFYLYRSRQGVKHERHSIVATGSMIAFYFVYYVVLRLNIGILPSISVEILRIQVMIGLALVAFGTVINIVGRTQLKGNWANHIKIYEGHSLVTRGVYSFARHPLYSSIIIMLFGGSLIYSNWVCAVLVAVVFVPSMVYRAKQEERLLIKEFPEYIEYKRQVGILFPKRLRGYRNEGV